LYCGESNGRVPGLFKKLSDIHKVGFKKLAEKKEESNMRNKIWII
jgi:hypothetical protein